MQTNFEWVIQLAGTLVSFVIVLVIWSAALRDLFTGMLFLCALLSWLVWKLSQPKEVE